MTNSENVALTTDERDQMVRINAQESAYAVAGYQLPNGDIIYGAPGLTKRELFAAMAMQGIFAHGYTMPNESCEAAHYAVQAADCLLKELAK